ncbi:MAG: hypothetical protein Q8K51_14035, partial [Nitrospirota bacterium]|nr:hypothetical protein [Nitrospirota bacterium]
IDCRLDSLLSEGWLIVSSFSKETIVVDWTSESGWAPLMGQNIVKYYGCSCVGTQYVLRKEDKSTMANSKISGKEVDLLKKENELLKKENEMLKLENERLKGKLKAKQKSKTDE